MTPKISVWASDIPSHEEMNEFFETHTMVF